MSMFLNEVYAAASRYARYRRTKSELQSLPIDVALDLDICQGDARRIARSAVYGV